MVKCIVAAAGSCGGMAPQNVSSGAAGASRAYGLILMLLTTLLSSASSLAVPSAAQKHFTTSGSDQHGTTLPITRPSQQQHQQQPTPVDPPTPILAAPIHLQQHERKQHGHRRPPVDSGGSFGGSSGEPTDDYPAVPDLYNLTLKAMRQYLRNHLNASRLGKAPRKRSHVQVDDVDVEFYRRFKEFNSSQVALDGTMHQVVGVVGADGLNSSQQQEGHPDPTTVQDARDKPSAADVTPAPSITTSASSSSSSSSAAVAPTGTGQRDYSVLMDDPRGYITASSSFPLRPGKTSTTWNTTFAQHRDGSQLIAHQWGEDPAMHEWRAKFRLCGTALALLGSTLLVLN
uniref:Uncharacterized protein n=1 Tax=Anopheles farauti TaxID=69004 RepID=A0A182QZ59_9DIPT